MMISVMSRGKRDVKVVERIIKKWKNDRKYVIEMLQDVQDEFRYIPKEALEVINRYTQAPITDMWHIATFYKAFSLEPRGKYEIQVCLGTACYVKGSERLMERLSENLEIKENETTPDMLFTLKSVRCIGCCGLAPAIMIGDEVYGKLSTKDIPKIIEKYKTME